MTSRYIIRPVADKDLDTVLEYLSSQAGAAKATQFLAEFQQTCDTLAGRPEIGWHFQVSQRRVGVVRVFRVSRRFKSYLIFYRPYRNRIEIIRILHGSQNLAALFVLEHPN